MVNPDRIYLFSGQDGLVSIRWDGTDEKAHVKVRGATVPGAAEPQNASLILMAPSGDQALALVNRHVFTVTVPYGGGDTPTISVAKPENAQFPAARLTDIGGEFPAWGTDGQTVHWSLGNAYFTYDIGAARVFKDSVAALVPDTLENTDDDPAVEEDAPDPARYEPVEVRIMLTTDRDIPEGTVLLIGKLRYEPRAIRWDRHSTTTTV